MHFEDTLAITGRWRPTRAEGILPMQQAPLASLTFAGSRGGQAGEIGGTGLQQPATTVA